MMSLTGNDQRQIRLPGAGKFRFPLSQGDYLRFAIRQCRERSFTLCRRAHYPLPVSGDHLRS